MKREELIERILEISADTEDEREEVLNTIEDYSKEELMDILEILEEAIEEENTSSDEDPERIAQLLACQEEELRQQALYTEEFEVSEEVANSDLFNGMMAMAECVTASVRKMVKGGIDYANALTICSNYLQNQHNLEMAKIGQVQVDKNQI